MKNDENLAAAQDMLMNVVRSESRVVLDPAPVTFVDSVSADSATVKLRYWVRSDSYFVTTRDVTKAMKLAFDERKAEVSAQPA